VTAGPSVETFVDVGGRRLRSLSLGSGTPAVVLEAGMGQTLETWRLVQPEVARWTRVVSYDRAGLGASDPAPVTRTCADLAADLRALLPRLDVHPPVVLVGHSLGGLVVRLYAHRHPEDVAGVVLVDAPNPAYPARALALLPPGSPGECAEVAESRALFRAIAEGTDAPDGAEAIVWSASLRQALAAASLGDTPLVVVSGDRPAPFDPDFPLELAARISALVRSCQRELVGLSTRGAHVVSPLGGHMVHLDQPELVVEAVRSLLDAARTERGP
jgi:pimeloyl-ACP methyl ester carboxylesterase